MSVSMTTPALKSKTELRLRLFDGGWTPLANLFKHPIVSWTKLEVTGDLIKSWDREGKTQSTGLRLDNGAIAFDWDVDTPRAVNLYRDACEAFPWLAGSLKRTGKGDKELWVLRCEVVFNRIATSKFKNPDPKKGPLLLEIFGDSKRQIGAFGPHSEGVEYTWHLNDDGTPRSPETVPLDNVEIITERQVWEVLDWTQQWLVDAGFEVLSAEGAGETTPHDEFTITDDMVFNPDESFGSEVSYAELCAICPTRISGSWLEGPSATNREKCIANFPDRYGGLSIHDFETGTTHHEKRFGPEEVARKAKEIGSALEALREQYGISAFFATPIPQKPELLVDMSNPDVTVEALGDILSECGNIYDRAGPVQVVYDQSRGRHVAQKIIADGLIPIAHRYCRPVTWKKLTKAEISNGDVEPKLTNAKIPKDLANMYLAPTTSWGLPPLNGISSAPLLREDGTILSTEGYDTASGIFLENLPDTSAVPENPTRAEADAALLVLRELFKTFPFADAEMVFDEALGAQVVDLRKPPGSDESGCLNALMTAVCRASLHLAPAVLINAPLNSGAGTGKGKIVRCITTIAFGHEIHAITAGGDMKETDKRIATESHEGSPALFLDNVNRTVVRSNQLASFITERPSRVRLLGKSETVELNASTFIILTGNALAITEDLVRRFIVFRLDAHIENPESRSFKTDPLDEAKERRVEFLNAALTIFRWGRLNPDLRSGKPLGSFEPWCRWVRDPLLALGCTDPVDRIREGRDNDPGRQDLIYLFNKWWDHHGNKRMLARDLHDSIQELLDPTSPNQTRTRQNIAYRLNQLDSMRIGGFEFICNSGKAKWGPKTYTLKRYDELGELMVPDGPLDVEQSRLESQLTGQGR